MKRRFGKKGLVFGTILLLVFIVFVGIPINTAAEDFILHPGYISGTVDIQGCTIIEYNSIVSARGYDPINQIWYEASAPIIDNQYTLVVESGDWEYDLRIQIRLDEGRWLSHGYFASVTVSEGEYTTANYQTDATIQGTVTVEGENVYNLNMQVWRYTPQGNFASYRVSQNIAGNSYSIPVISGDWSYCRGNENS
jgi:hypothetical protein